MQISILNVFIVVLVLRRTTPVSRLTCDSWVRTAPARAVGGALLNAFGAKNVPIQHCPLSLLLQRIASLKKKGMNILEDSNVWDWEHVKRLDVSLIIGVLKLFVHCPSHRGMNFDLCGRTLTFIQNRSLADQWTTLGRQNTKRKCMTFS